VSADRLDLAMRKPQLQGRTRGDRGNEKNGEPMHRRSV